MNTDKTEAMLSTTKPFVGRLRTLSFGNDNIKFVNLSRSLGDYIDNQLKWNKKVNIVAKSYSTKLSQLKRLRYLPKSVLEKIYYQYIVAGVVNCMPVWGTCSPSKAMFTLYRIVKRSVAESVLDRASVHTRTAAFEAVSAPEQYCSAPLLKVARSVSDRFLRRSESSLNTFIGAEIATEPRFGKLSFQIKRERCKLHNG